MKLVYKERLSGVGIDIENAPRWGFTDGYVWDQVTCVSILTVSEEPLVFDRSKLEFDEELLILAEWEAVKPVVTVEVDWRLKDRTLKALLQPIWDAIEEHDFIVGHNFQHDWSHLVTLHTELLTGRLPNRPVVDTRNAIPAGGFRDLDSLCYRYGLGVKPHLSSQCWTDAHQRGDAKAQKLVRYRNAIDVVLTERLYHKERELGWLS